MSGSVMSVASRAAFCSSSWVGICGRDVSRNKRCDEGETSHVD